MRLTFLARVLALTLLGVMMLPLLSAKLPAFAIYLAEARASTGQPARFESRAIVYRLQGDWSTRFAFSRPAEEIKLIVQPSVRPELRSYPAGFVYGLNLRLFDAKGDVIRDQQLHFHAGSPQAVYASGEKWRFFRGREEMVAGQDEVVVGLDIPAARMEVSLIDPDAGVIGADVRVYEQQDALGDSDITSFRRRSDAEKQALAAANAFPAAMLTDAEMSNLARNQWRPVGPLGINGRDYEAIVLYEASIAPDEQGAP